MLYFKIFFDIFNLFESNIVVKVKKILGKNIVSQRKQTRPTNTETEILGQKSESERKNRFTENVNLITQ